MSGERKAGLIDGERLRQERQRGQEWRVALEIVAIWEKEVEL